MVDFMKVGHIVLANERHMLENNAPELTQTIEVCKMLVKQRKEECLTLTFLGYDDDPRDLWHFNEVNTFCYRIMEEVPKVYNLCDSVTKSLLLYCTAKKDSKGQWRANAGWAGIVPNYQKLLLQDRDR